MITYSGHKVTPTELAKLVIADKGYIAVEYWHEDALVEVELMTEKEKDKAQEAIDRQWDRLTKFLGYWELREKVYAREDLTDVINEKLYG